MQVFKNHYCKAFSTKFIILTQKINNKIKKHGIIERINITDIEWEIQKKLRKLEKAIIKKVLEWNWWARNTRKTKNKNRDIKTKKST